LPPGDNRRPDCYTVYLGPVAQLVEQRIENPRVDGSIPSQATKQEPLSSQEGNGFFFVARPELRLTCIAVATHRSRTRAIFDIPYDWPCI
jgi:hypothetical protein